TISHLDIPVTTQVTPEARTRTNKRKQKSTRLSQLIDTSETSRVRVGAGANPSQLSGNKIREHQALNSLVGAGQSGVRSDTVNDNTSEHIAGHFEMSSHLEIPATIGPGVASIETGAAGPGTGVAETWTRKHLNQLIDTSQTSPVRLGAGANPSQLSSDEIRAQQLLNIPPQDQNAHGQVRTGNDKKTFQLFGLLFEIAEDGTPHQVSGQPRSTEIQNK
ncbi:hypothetical protein CROQUDRAFT_100693, partial [Cronartium quercuum f. sp. fusiforme G11]